MTEEEKTKLYIEFEERQAKDIAWTVFFILLGLWASGCIN